MKPEEVVNLLIVDDKSDNLMALEMSLEQENLKIFTTTSPREALDICINNDIAIALIDVQMPEMDGFELLDALKGNSLTTHILVILVTGISMNSEHVVRGLRNGAVDYLFKPLDLHITIAKVNSLITLVSYQKEIERKNKELENYQAELFKALEETEKSKAIKENFLANMSHEIRTPLNAIIGLLHLLNETTVDTQQHEMIQLMDFSAKSLIGIVNDILESAKIDAGVIEIKRAKTNIVQLVKKVCELTEPMAKDKGLTLKAEISPAVPEMVMADPLRLNQILLNLVNNSIKFTKSGSIKIGLNLLEQTEDKVQLAIIVKDSGIGIPKASIETIFTRFEQVDNKTWQKFGGTGLGLSIVKRLVELMGGAIAVESEVGVGTVLTFTNWYTLAKSAPDIDSSRNQISDLSNFDDNTTVLLVEDNKSNQYITSEMLKKWNIEVDIAVNGLQALEKLTKNDYHLILMDMHMPVMDGYEATRKIRQDMDSYKKDVPILSFSASVVQREREEAQSAGVDDFIEKPFEPENLHGKIKNLISNKKRATSDTHK